MHTYLLSAHYILLVDPCLILLSYHFRWLVSLPYWCIAVSMEEWGDGTSPPSTSPILPPLSPQLLLPHYWMPLLSLNPYIFTISISSSTISVLCSTISISCNIISRDGIYHCLLSLSSTIISCLCSHAAIFHRHLPLSSPVAFSCAVIFHCHLPWPPSTSTISHDTVSCCHCVSPVTVFYCHLLVNYLPQHLPWHCLLYHLLLLLSPMLPSSTAISSHSLMHCHLLLTPPNPNYCAALTVEGTPLMALTHKAFVLCTDDVKMTIMSSSLSRILVLSNKKLVSFYLFQKSKKLFSLKASGPLGSQQMLMTECKHRKPCCHQVC